MIGQHLRQLSVGELAWRQQLLTWKKKGFDVRQNISPGEHLLHFTSDSGWEGIIDLANWFAIEVPQSAEMSSQSWSLEQLETLFLNSKRPIDDLPDELEYQRLESKGFIQRTNILDSTYSCLTPQGRVWLYGLPTVGVHEYPYGELNVARLPLTLSYELGRSDISIGLLKRVAEGDVLFINHECYRVLSGNQVLSKYNKFEDGLMFSDENEDLYDEEMDSEEIDDEHSESMPIGNVDKLLPRDKIMITLSFVLQQSKISIAELESLYQGKVMPCDLEAEKNVLIMANGVAIARGEVIWIEDRMGIDIKDIYQEAGNDSR